VSYSFVSVTSFQVWLLFRRESFSVVDSSQLWLLFSVHVEVGL